MVKCAYLAWSGHFFQFPLDFLMRCFFMFTRISIVDAQLDLGLLSALVLIRENPA